MSYKKWKTFSKHFIRGATSVFTGMDYPLASRFTGSYIPDGMVKSCLTRRATGVFRTLAIEARGKNLAFRAGATGNGAALHRRPLRVTAD